MAILVGSKRNTWDSRFAFAFSIAEKVKLNKLKRVIEKT